MNDMDYINYISNDEIQDKLRNSNIGDKDMALINKFPEIKLPSKFFKNLGDAKFRDLQNEIEGAGPTFSNGAVYADLDNDGDLDVVVNNINDNALIYENKTNDKVPKPFMEVKLKGPPKNINAIGSKNYCI